VKRTFQLNTSHLIILAAIILSAAVVELSMGRLLISRSHHIRLWASTNTSELSQQLADAYSFSHILHGVLFYTLLRLTFRHGLTFAACLIIAVAIESSWEIIENTDFVIDRYRHATASLDYRGDTVLNSMSDIFFAILGFFLAARLPVWATVALFLTIELALLIVIRDNLTLNVLMLLHPVPAIKHWQMGLFLGVPA
jgi:hypothetical protein